MVERVKEFGAELEVLRFCQVQVFRQCEIEVNQARAAHHADAGSPEHLSLLRINQRESCGIEPFVNRLRPFRVPDQIGASAALAPKVQHVTAGLDRAQSEPALEGVNPGEVPAAEDGIDKWARAVSVSAPLPEGDLPNVADHSALLDVEFRQPMLGFDVEWILRLSKRPDVEAGADAAGREV